MTIMWPPHRQDSVSTYEEVESLNSHQLTTFNSQESSSCPSRLESCGESSSGSLDHGLFPQYGNAPGVFAQYQVDAPSVDPRLLHPELQSPGSTDSSRTTSTCNVSFTQSPGEYGTSSPMNTPHENPNKDCKRSDVNVNVANWVNQSYVQSSNLEKDARYHLSPQNNNGKPDGVGSRSNSMERSDADASPMTYHSMSPAYPVTRAASMDSGFPQFPGAHGGFSMPWTPAENMLMTLGFGSMDLGIPERFMQSWRDNIIKKRIGELHSMLAGNQRPPKNPNVAPLSRQGSETDQSMEDFRIGTRPKVSPPSPIQEQREKEHQANIQSTEQSSKTDPRRPSPVPHAAEQQYQIENMRRRFKKAATIGSFSSYFLRQQHSQPNSTNSSPCATPDLQRRQVLPNGKKFNQLRPSERGSAKDRRRKFNRQSSLPISLETLPEEDEGQRSKPQSFSESFYRSQNSFSKENKKTNGRERPGVPPLKIVTEQASLEMSEAKSYGMAKQESKDEAIADMNEAKKDMLNMEQYLSVIKTMIDSKDSGIGNDPSNEGSPQMSPRTSACADEEPRVNTHDIKNENTKDHPAKVVTCTESEEKERTMIGLQHEKRQVLDQLKMIPKHISDNLSNDQDRSLKENSNQLSLQDDSKKGKASAIGVHSPLPYPKHHRKASLIAMQEAFCQTVMEEEEEVCGDEVFLPNKKKQDAFTVIDVDVGVQTSPGLMSQPLSPLQAGENLNPEVSEMSSDHGKGDHNDPKDISLVVLAPDSMNVEASSYALSTEDETSSLETVNTQISEMSVSSHQESLIARQPADRLGATYSGNPNQIISENTKSPVQDSHVESFHGNDLYAGNKVPSIESELNSHSSELSGIIANPLLRDQGHTVNSEQWGQSVLCSEHGGSIGDESVMSDVISVGRRASDQRIGRGEQEDREHVLRHEGSLPFSVHDETHLPHMGKQSQEQDTSAPSESSSCSASIQVKCNWLPFRNDCLDHSDDMGDRDNGSSKAESILSTQSYEFPAPPISNAGSGIFQISKPDLDFPDRPHIKSSVVSSNLGRQYEALLKSALEKERARKHLTVAETLHLAIVKLETIVEERRLCRHTQLHNVEGSRRLCKFCDTKRGDSSKPKRLVQELHKRHPLKPNVTTSDGKKPAVCHQSSTDRPSVERTQSAPIELLQRAPSQDRLILGTDARVNSIASDFSDAIISVTGDTLVDIGAFDEVGSDDAVSKELTEEISLSDITAADVKSIQAFHVLHENANSPASAADQNRKKDKEDNSNLPQQRRRSLFAVSSKSGSRLLLRNGSFQRTKSLSTKDTGYGIDEQFSFDLDAFKEDEMLIDQSEDAEKVEPESITAVQRLRGKQPNCGVSLSIDKSNVTEISSEGFDPSDHPSPVLSNVGDNCFIVVDACQTNRDHTNSTGDGYSAVQQIHKKSSDNQEAKLKVQSHESFVIPPSSPFVKLTPQLSQSSKPPTPFSPKSNGSGSASFSALLSSPMSLTTRTSPVTSPMAVGESPVHQRKLRVSVLPTINLARLSPPVQLTIDLTSPTCERDESCSEGASSTGGQSQQKFRSELFLQLPEPPVFTFSTGSSVTPYTPNDLPVSPVRLEYLPSFYELCNKAESMITNLKTLKDPALVQPKDLSSSHGFIPIQDHADIECSGDLGSVDQNSAQSGSGDSSVQNRDSSLRLETTPPEDMMRVGAVGLPQLTSTPQPKHASMPHPGPGGQGGAVYGGQMEQREHQIMVQHMLQSESSLRSSLEAMEASLQELKRRKQDAIEELKHLQDAVKRNRGDIQQAEEITRMTVEKGDGLRSELMVLEYQRDQARRELKDLEEGIEARRSPRPGEGRGGAPQPGMSEEEILAVVGERDDLRAQLEEMRRGGARVSREEQEEAERQLEQIRQELFESQKASRAKVEKLQEDLEESRGKIDSLKQIEDDLKQQLVEVRETLTNSENEHAKQLQEKTVAMETLQTKSEAESSGLRQKLQESTQRVTSLENALMDKDVVTTRMQERIRGQSQEVLELTNHMETLEREKEAGARSAETAKEVALVELRDRLLKEKQEEMNQQKTTLEKTHNEVLTKHQTQASQRRAQLEKQIEEQAAELTEVQRKLAQQEESTRTLGDQMRQEAQEQIKKSIEEQKAVWEVEREKEKQREALAKEDAVAIETKCLRDELKTEQQQRNALKTSLNNLKQEMEKLREDNLAAGREKVEAVSNAREEARREIQSQLDQIRDQMMQEKTRETEKLQQKLKQQDEELTQLRSEVKGHRQKQRDDSSTHSGMDSTFRSIVIELNEECRKTSGLVGSTPRKVPLFKNTKSPSHAGTPKSSYNSPGRTQLMAAVSNLKATNDDLRNYIKSLRDDLEKQRRATARANREKENEVKKLAESMGREKAQIYDNERDMELERMQRMLGALQETEGALQQRVDDKDEELRQIQSNMAAWKEETALKMARKFEDELNKELGVRLEESYSGSSMRSGHSEQRSRNSTLGTSSPSSLGSSDTNTTKLLRHLQDRVKNLRQENLSLKHASRHDNSQDADSSLVKMQLEEKEQQLYRLDQKVKLQERQLWVAEERCRENAALLSQKTAENTRLEGALTQQTKELMKAERAYNKLSLSTSSSPVP